MNNPKLEYFGPAKYMKLFETRIKTPVGQECMHCHEAIKEGDVGTMQHFNGALVPLHHECALRGIAGSVGHQRKLCSCFGGTEEDPEGMTTRQAAIAAADYFYKHGERF